MKVFKRIILAGLVLVVALTLAAYFAIKIAFPPGKIKALVHEHGTAALNRDVRVQDVSIGVFPNLKLSVTEVSVANAPGFSKEPALKLRELALSIDFLSLLRFAPVINEIKLVGPEILYEVDARGRNNLEGIGKPDSTAAVAADTGKTALESPAAVALKSFVIVDGRVRYRDMQSGREISLEKINQLVSLDLDQRLEDVKTRGKLEIAEIKVSDSASGLRKGDIRISLRHDIHLNLPAERVQVRSLELGFQDIRATVKGEATRFMTKPPKVDFTLSAPDIKLASVLKEVPASLSPDIPKLRAKGVAALEAHVEGVLDSGAMPAIAAGFTIRDGGVSHAELPAGLDNLAMDLRIVGDTIALDKLAFKVGENPVALHALLTSWRKPVPMLAACDLDAAVDFGKVVPLLQKLALIDKGLKAQGLLRARLAASGPLDPAAPQNLHAQGSAELKDVAAEGGPLPAPVRASGQVKVDNEKIAQNLDLRIGQSDLKLEGTVSDYLALALPKAAPGKRAKAKLVVSSGFLNLDELMPAGAKKEEEEKAGPPMQSFPRLPPLDAEVDVRLAKTQLMNLAMTDYTSKTVLAGDRVTTAMKGSLYSGGFATDLKADLGDSSDAKVKLKLAVDRVEANDFISRLNDRLPAGNRLMKSLSRADSMLFGKINLKADLATHGLPQTFADNLTGTLSFALADGRLAETGLLKGLSDALSKYGKDLSFRELTFAGFQSDLEAVGGKLLVKHADISESVVGAILAAGVIGFDNTLDLQIESHLPAKASAVIAGAGSALTSELSKLPGAGALGKASLVPTDKAGRAVVYMLVGGTLAKPVFSVDKKRMLTEATGGAKNALNDALRKKQEELKAKAAEERARLESQARAKADSAKAQAEAVLEEQKKKAAAAAEEQKKKAAEEAKKQGKKVLKGFGL